MAANPGWTAESKMREILQQSKTIAIVGLSDNPMRPSHGVGEYLHDAGYRVIPVNPKLKELFGEKAYPDLLSVKAAGIDVDLVDVFRDPAHVGPVVDEALRIGAKALWLQEGVVNVEAAEKAQRGGLRVVMDRCAMKEHARLMG